MIPGDAISAGGVPSPVRIIGSASKSGGAPSFACLNSTRTNPSCRLWFGIMMRSTLLRLGSSIARSISTDDAAFTSRRASRSCWSSISRESG